MPPKFQAVLSRLSESRIPGATQEKLNSLPLVNLLAPHTWYWLTVNVNSLGGGGVLPIPGILRMCIKAWYCIIAAIAIDSHRVSPLIPCDSYLRQLTRAPREGQGPSMQYSCVMPPPTGVYLSTAKRGIKDGKICCPTYRSEFHVPEESMSLCYDTAPNTTPCTRPFTRCIAIKTQISSNNGETFWGQISINY